MSGDVFNVNEEISRLLESDNPRTRSLGGWLQKLSESTRPTLVDRRRYEREKLTVNFDAFKKRFTEIVTSNGEAYDEFTGVYDKLISFSLKDLKNIASATLIGTRFFLDDLKKELVIILGFDHIDPYTHKVQIHSVKLGEKYLDSETSEIIDYTLFDKIIYLFSSESMGIIDFLYSVAKDKYPVPLSDESNQIIRNMRCLISENLFKFTGNFFSPDKIYLIYQLLNFLGTYSKTEDFADKLIQEKLRENVKAIEILYRLTLPTSEELEEKRKQMFQEKDRKVKEERDSIIEIFRTNSKGIVSKCLDDGVLRELTPDEYSTEDQELMSKIHLFSLNYNTDVIWIKSKIPKFKNQLIIVSDSFTISNLTRGSVDLFFLNQLTPDSLRDPNFPSTSLFDSKYQVRFVKYSDNLGEFINNVFRPARVSQYKLEGEIDSKTVRLIVPHRQRWFAISPDHIHLRRGQILLKTYFGIDDVKVHKV